MFIVKFIKQYFIIGIFTGNHIKIDTTVEGVEGPARQSRPKYDQVDTSSKKETKEIEA